MGQAFNDYLIFTGTVRSFYSRDKAEAFCEVVRERGYGLALSEESGQDLRWTVTVLGERAAPPEPAAEQPAS